MLITLTSHTDPSKRIQAIKALRSVTEPVMGLREAKLASDGLLNGTPFTFVGTVTPELRENFTLIECDDDTDDQLVIDFIIDVFALSDPETSVKILGLSSYSALREALR